MDKVAASGLRSINGVIISYSFVSCPVAQCQLHPFSHSCLGSSIHCDLYDIYNLYIYFILIEISLYMSTINGSDTRKKRFFIFG